MYNIEYSQGNSGLLYKSRENEKTSFTVSRAMCYFLRLLLSFFSIFFFAFFYLRFSSQNGIDRSPCSGGSIDSWFFVWFARSSSATRRVRRFSYKRESVFALSSSCRLVRIDGHRLRPQEIRDCISFFSKVKIKCSRDTRNAFVFLWCMCPCVIVYIYIYIYNIHIYRLVYTTLSINSFILRNVCNVRKSLMPRRVFNYLQENLLLWYIKSLIHYTQYI